MRWIRNRWEKGLFAVRLSCLLVYWRGLELFAPYSLCFSASLKRLLGFPMRYLVRALGILNLLIARKVWRKKCQPLHQSHRKSREKLKPQLDPKKDFIVLLSLLSFLFFHCGNELFFSTRELLLFLNTKFAHSNLWINHLKICEYIFLMVFFSKVMHHWSFESTHKGIICTS